MDSSRDYGWLSCLLTLFTGVEDRKVVVVAVPKLLSSLVGLATIKPVCFFLTLTSCERSSWHNVRRIKAF